jgi:hypothetical protein
MTSSIVRVLYILNGVPESHRDLLSKTRSATLTTIHAENPTAPTPIM